MPPPSADSRSTSSDLPPLLRRRLLVVAALVALAAGFFSTYRAVQPIELAYFQATPGGRLLLGYEALFSLGSAVAAAALWRWPAWWTLTRLRVVEYVLVCALATYIGWTQLFAFAGERVAARAATEPYLIRLVTDSLAVRWAAAIIGLSALIPETLRRNSVLVGAQVTIALVLTTLLATTDPVYAPRAPHMIVLMVFWMTLAATIAIFGAAKLEELRQQVAEARRLGQYQLVRKIGAGGMGEVYLAEHLLLKQPVAIKLIRPDRAGDPEALARFEHEVRTTARLTHWNTVQIYDYGYTADGTFYYAMEYLPGLTLEQIVQRHGAMPPARAIHFLRQIAAALHEAHAMHLVHRDVKPANVMVCTRGGVHDVAKLLDFGLVRGGGPAAETVFDSHQILGTPGYMAPEQAQGGADLTPAADLYGVGATGYLLVTGDAAFARGHAVQMLVAQSTTAPAAPRRRRPDLPADLDAVIMRCLERDPARRFATAAELDLALAGCADAGGWSDEDAARWWRAHPIAGDALEAASMVTGTASVGRIGGPQLRA
ncbi:MAG: serine/threonine-protein kinase [Vicinamibacterales bacterium]